MCSYFARCDGKFPRPDEGRNHERTRLLKQLGPFNLPQATSKLRTPAFATARQFDELFYVAKIAYEVSGRCRIAGPR